MGPVCADSAAEVSEGFVRNEILGSLSGLCRNLGVLGLKPVLDVLKASVLRFLRSVGMLRLSYRGACE